MQRRPKHAETRAALEAAEYRQHMRELYLRRGHSVLEADRLATFVTAEQLQFRHQELEEMRKKKTAAGGK